MKIAYVFATPSAAAYKLGTMILPQLEAGSHGVEVVGMFFFDDNTFFLRAWRSPRRAARNDRPGARHAAHAVRPVRGRPRTC
jgi:hypothetical protein